MELTGYLAEDSPDPRGARLTMIAGLGIPVAGLVPQRHLEDRGEAGHSSSRHRAGDGPDVLEAVTVSLTYLLWRNPDDHDDPVNLADLDEATRATLDAPLARPIPAWLQEARRMLRYPRLWEAVWTSWTRPGADDRPSLQDRMIAHAEHVLTNTFRQELGLQDGDWAPPIPPAALQAHRVVVDGAERDGLLLDTDPFVLGLGAELDDGRMLTAVLPRDALPLLVLQFASDVPVGPAP